MSDDHKTKKSISVEPEEFSAAMQFDEPFTEPVEKETKTVAAKKPQLALDTSNITKTRTRTELAAQLYTEVKEEDGVDKTLVFASHPKRAIALILDLLFFGFLYFVVLFSTPLFRGLIKMFMDRYKRQFIFPESVVMNTLTIVVAFLTIFFGIVVPAAFFNRSFGKKMLGLKVRSDERYNLSLRQACEREYVYKPLSILILLGLFIPFFNKKKQSLHDFLAKTVVIEEKEKKI
jgi:uncharacterized RDD family membrane protein YckC